MICLYYVNLAYTMYVGIARPFSAQKRNRIEMMNEFQYSIICYFMIVFTDYIKVTEQYQDGYIIIGLIGFFFVSNMVIVWQ